MAVHAYAFLVCFYREIFLTKVGLMGGIMKSLELFGIYFYFAGIVNSLAMFSFWMYELPKSEMFEYLNSDETTSLALAYKRPSCFEDKKLMKQWAGGSIDWVICEIVIFISYVSTLILLIIKSRFFGVGIDQT